MNACLGMSLEYHINLHQPTSSFFLSNNLQSFCARVRTRFGRDPNWSILHSKISKAQFALNRSWCPNPITFLQHTGQKSIRRAGCIVHYPMAIFQEQDTIRMPTIMPKMNVPTWTHIKSNEGSSNLRELKDFPPLPTAILRYFDYPKAFTFEEISSNPCHP